MILADDDAAKFPSDVCIVGAGPVGLALAFKLEALGLTVTLLEMGEEEADTSALRGQVEFRNSHHAPSTAMSRPGIGGTSALWGGRCVELDDLDFDLRAHVPHSGWPIPHAELSRHYKEALGFLGCSTRELALFQLAVSDQTVSPSSIERWSREPSLGPVYASRLASSQNIRVLSGALVTEVVPEAENACVGYLKVRRHDREFEVRAKSYVLAGGGLENTRLLLALGKRSPAIANAFGTALGVFYQGHLTGYIATIQLNDPSEAAALAFRKDEDGLIYRQRLQVAPAVQLEQQLLNTVFWIDPISIADPEHNSGAFSICYLFFSSIGLYRFVSKGLAPSSKGLSGSNRKRHWRNVREDLKSPLKLFRTIRSMISTGLRDKRTLINPKGRYLLRYHSEQVPAAESHVSLQSSGSSDRRGGLLVDYRVTTQDLDSVVRSHQIIDEWLRRNELGKLDYLHERDERQKAVADQALDGYHQIGLARMASHPSDGPINPDCRLWGMSNLYVAGSCLFPTSSHANPTLPAVALALRLAEHLREQNA